MRPKTQVRFCEAENARVNTILKTNSVEQKAGAKIENKKKFERLTPSIVVSSIKKSWNNKKSSKSCLPGQSKEMEHIECS